MQRDVVVAYVVRTKLFWRYIRVMKNIFRRLTKQVTQQFQNRFAWFAMHRQRQDLIYTPTMAPKLDIVKPFLMDLVSFEMFAVFFHGWSCLVGTPKCWDMIGSTSLTWAWCQRHQLVVWLNWRRKVSSATGHWMRNFAKRMSCFPELAVLNGFVLWLTEFVGQVESFWCVNWVRQFSLGSRGQIFASKLGCNLEREPCKLMQCLSGLFVVQNGFWVSYFLG